MANFAQSFEQNYQFTDTFTPQSFTTTAGGTGIAVAPFGTDQFSARLSVGDVTVFTSLAVKLQASVDNSNWDDISGATFATVTAANTAEVLDFKMPRVASATALPYIYVRAHGTLVGTSCRMTCVIFSALKYDGAAAYRNAPPTNN